jgi:hypothetical protein
MAGEVSQSESDLIYRRLAQVAVQLVGLAEEVDRLDASRIALDLATNLDPQGGGQLSVAQAVALFTELLTFRNWWLNNTVGSTGVEGSPDRRAIIAPFILAEPLL